jgi:hypothetical protein
LGHAVAQGGHLAKERLGGGGSCCAEPFDSLPGKEVRIVAVVDYQDLPLADRDRRWDGAAANKRVRKWARADNEPNDRYVKAFLWYEPDDADLFKGYKLQIADVVEGKLKAVPRAIISAAGVVQGARGGVDLPTKDVAAVKRHLARYYAKMDEEPPWDD